MKLKDEIKDEILTILLEQMKEYDSPWVNAEVLRLVLEEHGKKLTKEALSLEVGRLGKDGYVEIKSLDSDLLVKGFIVRLTIPGRNLWRYGVSSLTGL